ncbi:MAG: hypothetical protein IJW86_04670 [Clostridia bacterium]|nr:hypothetical protein [Clostridia bacterium]
MYISFKNNSTSNKVFLSVGNQKHVINPGETTEVFCQGEPIQFTAQTATFDNLIDGINELGNDIENESLKDRILFKLTKKFAEKIPEAVLDTSVRYELSDFKSQNIIVDLTEGAYSVCDGEIADYLDLLPVEIVFSRAETTDGQIRVLDATATNRKKFLKLVRNILLFMHWGLIFVDLFYFIPEYLTIKYFSSHFYIKKLFTVLYSKPADERRNLLSEKELIYEEDNNNNGKRKKKGCLSGIIKVFIVLLILGGVCFWAMTSEPDTIISEDFQTVVCFDEVFVKIDGGLPEDAEKVFLGDYTAYYPLPDGGYDMDNYYCYIYEDSAGSRYMWLKDNCSNRENADKGYADYETPLVYKSTGKAD